MRRCPSTTVVSLPNACVLSRVWALASISWAVLYLLALICDRNLPMVLLDVQVRLPHLQQWLIGEPAHRRPVALGGREGDLAAGFGREPAVASGHGEARRHPLDVPLERAGQGLVESLTSKTSRRAGEANAPKLDRCASPHSCTHSPDVGVVARSAAIGSAAPR